MWESSGGGLLPLYSAPTAAAYHFIAGGVGEQIRGVSGRAGGTEIWKMRAEQACPAGTGEIRTGSGTTRIFGYPEDERTTRVPGLPETFELPERFFVAKDIGQLEDFGYPESYGYSPKQGFG